MGTLVLLGRRGVASRRVFATALVVLAALAGLRMWAEHGGRLVAPGASGAAQTTAGTPAVSALMKLPAAARGPVSAALGADNVAYQISGLAVRNPAQHFEASFTAAGTTIASRGARFTIGLDGAGRGLELRPLRSVAPRAGSRQVSYTYPGATEQWRNGPLGLEQSFILDRRPVGTAPLALAVGSASGTHMVRGEVELPGGLVYTGVRATDARGRVLRAWLGLSRGQIVIRVNDRGMRYPLTIDPFVQQAQLSSSDGVNGDYLGYSVAVDGSTIAVGAPRHASNSITDSGAVYVFQEGAHGWANGTQTAELTATDALAGSQLGTSVGISGNTIVAGAPYVPDGGDWSTTDCSQVVPGTVYEYTMPAGGWHNMTQSGEITPTFSGFCSGAEFGQSLAVDGNTLVVGAPNYRPTEDGNGGAAFVYTLGSSNPPAILTSSDQEQRSGLGFSVGISGNTIVAGDPYWNGVGYYGKGSAYVYVMPPGGWVSSQQSAKLAPSDAGAGDDFGWSVGVDGSTVAVGAPFHGAGGSEVGALYVFEQPAAGWSGTIAQTSELSPSEGDDDTGLGYAVAISGNSILGGAADDAGAADSGAAYLFTEPSGGWPATMTQSQEITQTPAEHGSYFGSQSVAIDGKTIVIGDTGGEPGGVSTYPQSGLVDVFGAGVTAPTTPKISKVTVSKAKHRATFAFRASGTSVRFQCALVAPAKKGKRPKVAFASCRSPKTYEHLHDIRYTFEVKALNAGGTSKTATRSVTI